MSERKNGKGMKDDIKFIGSGPGHDQGLTWEQFRRKVVSWCREKYGEKWGTMLWTEQFPAIALLDRTDPVQETVFVEYVTLTHKVIARKDARSAEKLWDSDHFWTIVWQLSHRDEQREYLYCYLEKITEGEALRQVEQLDVKGMPTMREHLYTRFGGVTSASVKVREKNYLLGMPKKAGAIAFPDGVCMTEKLDQLEGEREYFLDVCPPHLRENVRLLLGNASHASRA